MDRPFFNESIIKLESDFEERLLDERFLKILSTELSFRSTDRAKKLRGKVENAIGSLKHSKITRTENAAHVGKAVEIKAEAVTATPKVNSISVTKSNSDFSVDSAEGIISSWIALEVLSPQAFKRPEELAQGGDRRLIVNIDQSLPWSGDGEKSKPNYKLYYQVVIGTVDMEKAINKLLEVYGDNRTEKPSVKGEAIIASAVVNKLGCVIDDSSVSVSSFAWGVPQALTGNLETLANWSSVEDELNEYVAQLLRKKDEDGKDLPLNLLTIENAYNKIVLFLGLPPELIRSTRFAIRTYQYFTNSETPEPLLLNSFYINDLTAACKLFKNGNDTRNLRLYLGLEPPASRVDILNDSAALLRVLSPSRIPAARWPGPGRHPLVMLQQAAVNLVASELKEDGVVAVNGPPGTGKTTLLRDIVAKLISDRAEAMCHFDDPESAFTSSGEKLKAGQGWVHLYQLDERIKGYEMLIASSNNKAVENVSAELPGIKAVAGDIPELKYFTTMSNALLDRETWGMIAAVLGNMNNKAKFRKDGFWDKDSGISTYLLEASGTPQFIEETDDKGKKTERKPRIIVDNDAPSSKAEALGRWAAAKSRFQRASQKSREALSLLQEMEEKVIQLPILEQAKLEAERILNHDIQLSNILQKKIEPLALAKSLALIELNQVEVKLTSHRNLRPNLIHRIFNTKKAKEWRVENSKLNVPYKSIKDRIRKLEIQLNEHERKLTDCNAKIFENQSIYDGAAKKHDLLRRDVENISLQLGDHLIDTATFFKKREDLHKISPWCTAVVQELRDRVFIESVNLHKAFVDASAKKLRHNLGALMMVFSGPFSDEAKNRLIPDLWSSLFLVVPVVSSTFASIERMFHNVPPESLGWLLVDEAGQALPQAIVGALTRTKKAVIVGDPIQIEPIVVLPASLTRNICKSFNVDPDKYNAPEASTQTLADAATSYYAEFQTRLGSRTVGVPLLVHRRCEEPMFGISNAIAYNRQMVFAKVTVKSPIRDCLGPSSWIDVSGTANEKWCPEEGQIIVQLLTKLKSAKIIPDLYIVTPFVIVADQLRLVIQKSGVLNNWVEDVWWVFERIGTVHTVQGREAEAVILVLGAQDTSQAGARNWAGGKPNLLNVAVTRAKETLYVVGNKKLWQRAGVFEDLLERMPD